MQALQASSAILVLLRVLLVALASTNTADEYDFSRISVEVKEIHNGTTCSSASFSLGERMEKGEIVLQLSNALNLSEVQYLVQSASAAADQHEQLGLTCPGADGGFQGRARMPTLRAAQREGCIHNALPQALSQKMEAILLRMLTYIDTHLPTLATTLLHTQEPPAKSSVHLFSSDRLDYNKREPAINIYTENGQFGIHADLKGLTLLFPLASPGVDFEGGGGTAFWPPPLEYAQATDPTLILVPPPGSVLLFGGRVPHKGLAIAKGTRLVFVASFSRKVQLRRWPNGTYTRTYT